MSERFALAPMDRLNRGLTGVTVPLPFVLLAVGARFPAPLLEGVGVLFLALWGFIWFYMRPSHFEVGPAGLLVRWPWRSEFVPRHALAGAEVLSRREVKKRYGHAMRVGAGGLGGGFGLAWTRKGFLRFYVSRIDRFVVVHCREGRDWMITPADPERFVAAIQDA
jgi:hypothetical protein